MVAAMCGIAGVSLRSGAKAALPGLRPLAAALAHRGPDGEGFFAHGNIGLVHRRLSIIDVDGGRQPLTAGPETAPLALVGNGEIYNYKAMQMLAVQRGAQLATQSDCEPPLHRFAQVGAAMWDELEGMYAIALADCRSGEVHLAVDPFGIKPLYYTQNADGLAFASEPRALAAAGWATAEPNMAVLGGVLNRHYSTGADTLFKGVFRLLPGERLTVKDGEIVARARRAPKLAAARTRVQGDEVGAFGLNLQAAVGRHLQADVPYGVLLSGGLDSSALVVAMRALGAPIHAFTAQIDVDGAGPGEADAAAALAKKLGATHTTVRYGREDFWPGLARFADAMDDLATDYAALPLLKLTETAAQHVKILLSGEGGDEMLAGYGNYRKKQTLLRMWKARRAGDATPYRGLFRHKKLVRVPTAATGAWDSSNFSTLQGRQARDVAGWLPHDLLLKLDRTTMANGIEGRVPFLDDRFAAYAFALPDSLKTEGTWGKLILRQHLERNGLGEMAWARKQGFSVAVGAFLGEKTQGLKALWARSRILQELLKPTAADALLGQLSHAKAANLAFSLTLLALWERVHMDGQDFESLGEELADLR